MKYRIHRCCFFPFIISNLNEAGHSFSAMGLLKQRPSYSCCKEAGHRTSTIGLVDVFFKSMQGCSMAGIPYGAVWDGSGTGIPQRKTRHPFHPAPPFHEVLPSFLPTSTIYHRCSPTYFPSTLSALTPVLMPIAGTLLLPLQ